MATQNESPGPKPTILVMEGRYHLGNTPGIFQDATFVGWSVAFPVTVSWYDEGAPEVAFVIRTQDIESWGGAGGHRVTLNDVVIGRLDDTSRAGVETFRVAVPTERLREILNGQRTASLGFAVEVIEPPSDADDFVLRRIETEETMVMRFGVWPERAVDGAFP